MFLKYCEISRKRTRFYRVFFLDFFSHLVDSVVSSVVVINSEFIQFAKVLRAVSMKRQLKNQQGSRKRSKSFSLFLSPHNHHSSEMKIFRDFEDIMAEEQRKRKVWKLVLTGGPCGGKTTGQTRLATFFENLGWKVYRVPETANILLSGGVNFAELTPEAAEKFQVRFKIIIF